MEEDIMILESECYYLEELGYLRENNHFIRFNQALKNLIKGYRELEAKLNQLLKYEDDLRIKERAFCKENHIPKSKIEEYIEKNIKYHQKNILDIENVTLLKEKTLKEQTEIEFNKYALAIYSRMLSDFMEDK